MLDFVRSNISSHAVSEAVEVREREHLGVVGGVAALAQRLERLPQERVQPDRGDTGRSIYICIGICAQ